jgi:hypothetical protein
MVQRDMLLCCTMSAGNFQADMVQHSSINMGFLFTIMTRKK